MQKVIQPQENLSICGIHADYFEGLRYLEQQTDHKRLVLFLGSNIGNFTPSETKAFLKKLQKTLRPLDFVLIGFDLRKDIDVLTRAYNDPEGITAEFNLNLLIRINTELGGNFDLDRFEHYGFYNPLNSAMESYLLSKQSQTVDIPATGRSFDFQPYEPIHTEYSFKFLDSDIQSLAQESGFKVVNLFTDNHNYFIDALWQVK